MTNITGVIITLNEEQNIAECIASLQQVCNEIIVVDSNSTDSSFVNQYNTNCYYGFCTGSECCGYRFFCDGCKAQDRTHN